MTNFCSELRLIELGSEVESVNFPSEDSLKLLNTEPKRNSATQPDLSVEIKDLEQIKGPERYLNLDRMHDRNF